MKRKAATQASPAYAKKAKKTTVRAGAGYQAGREMTKAPKVELKAFDVALTASPAHGVTAGAASAGPPVFNILNAVINGAELYQRTGRKIYMKSLHLRGLFQPTGVSVEGGARLFVIYDSQPNAALPLIAPFLQDSNAAAATTWTSELNLTNRQRFQILRDYQVILGPTTGATTEAVPDPIKNSYNVDFFIKLHGLESIFNGTNGGTIADITSGSLLLMWVVDDVATNWTFNWSSRLRYYD